MHAARNVRMFAAALAVAATALTGCSGDDEPSESSPTTAGTESTVAPTDEEEADSPPEVTAPDSELCRLASEPSPDLASLPDLLPEELRAEATQFAEAYNEWRASGSETAPPETPEGIITYLTQECVPELDGGAVDPDVDDEG